MLAAREMLDDLLNIEVNTIIKPGMTGRKMPAPGHAVLDIFSNYDLWLCEHTGRINNAWRTFPPGLKRAFLESVHEKEEQRKWWIVKEDGTLIETLEVTALFDPGQDIRASDFEALRKRARMAEELHRVMTGAGRPFETGSGVMLARIIRNCDQLMKILRAHGTPEPQPPDGESQEPPSRDEPPRDEPSQDGDRKPSATLSRSADDGVADASGGGLTSEEIVQIRKVWELGTETIVMQTVVQLDGDVVTRIDEARTAVDEQALRDLHRQSVDTALGHWSSLVDTVVRLANAVLGRGA